MYVIEIMLDINCDVWEFYIINGINLILILKYIEYNCCIVGFIFVFKGY